MKSLAIFKYGQEVSGEGRLRIGVVDKIRDTNKDIVRNTSYRYADSSFYRSQFLLTIRQRKSTACFYRHAIRGVEIPYLGSLLSPFFGG